MPIPALPLFKHRDTVVTPADQNQFVTQFENTMDTLSNGVIPALNLAITDINDKVITATTARDESEDARDIAVAAKDEALTAVATLQEGAIDDTTIAPNKAFSNQYIENNYYDKTEVDTAISDANQINTLLDKPTPENTDNLALQETGGLLKKLSFANLKNWILSLFNPSLTGTVSFNSTTNNISLTNIVTALGLEIGDVIQISGATDSKNNSEFTIEVITDANNIIVNQAHANKGTSKNVANRSGDTDVTIKLLAKYYNAPVGLGQGWVDVTSSRSIGVSYPNATNRTIIVNMSARFDSTPTAILSINNVTVNYRRDSGYYYSTLHGEVSIDGNYIVSKVGSDGTLTKQHWSESR